MLQELVEKIRKDGLHKTAAARLRKGGHDISDSFEPAEALRVFGERFYKKAAEQRVIQVGLDALNKIERGE